MYNKKKNIYTKFIRSDEFIHAAFKRHQGLSFKESIQLPIRCIADKRPASSGNQICYWRNTWNQ